MIISTAQALEGRQTVRIIILSNIGLHMEFHIYPEIILIPPQNRFFGGVFVGF